VKEVKKPMVFDLRVIEKNENKCVVKVGIASDYRITEGRIVLYDIGPGPVIKISAQTGFQNVKIENLRKGNSYSIQAAVVNEKEGEASKWTQFRL